MKLPKSKMGITFSIIYLLVSIFLILSQGLFGESFITIVLGLPWTYLMAYFNFYQMVSENNPLFHLWLYIVALGPIIVNIILLYWIGVGIERLFLGEIYIKLKNQNK